MFIVVHHEITNKEAFFGAAESVVGDVPDNIKPLQFFPSIDREQAVCLWEGPSVDTVKDYIEAKVGESSNNTYYPVDSEIAVGLPLSV